MPFGSLVCACRAMLRLSVLVTSQPLPWISDWSPKPLGRPADKIKLRHGRLFPAYPNRPRPQDPEPQPLVAQGQGSGGRELSYPKKTGGRPRLAYGLRVGAVSEYWRMLGPSHRDLHAAGRYLHSPLRLLRGPPGAPGRD